jgi:hypothetical protein
MKKNKFKVKKNITAPYIKAEIIKLISEGVLTPTTASQRYNIGRQTIYEMLRSTNTNFIRYQTHIGNKFALSKKDKTPVTE